MVENIYCSIYFYTAFVGFGVAVCGTLGEKNNEKKHIVVLQYRY